MNLNPMLLTWTLWRGLKKPAGQHPLFQRVLTAPPQMIPWYLACGLIVTAPFLLLPALVFMSAVYGLRWAVMIATAIAREQESGMYELTALTPPGALGSSRAIMTACLYRNESLAQIQSLGAWALRLSFGIVLMLSLETFSTPIIRYDVDPFLGQIITPLYLMTLGIAVYLDHVQSIVIAELVGMLIPVYVRRRQDAGISAGAAYAVLQVGSYALTLVFGFALLSPLLDALPIAPQARTLVLPFLRLAIFYGVREIIIGWLWRTLVRETNAAASEIELA
jgi:hypothetical protein